MIKLFTYIVFLSGISVHCCAQWIASDSIDASRLSPWEAKSRADYQGVYEFGDSEWESELVIIITPNAVFAQIRSGHWSSDGKAWIKDFENIAEPLISVNRFLSSKTDGEFVYYDNGTTNVPGLKIMKSWSGLEKGNFEVGLKTGSLNEYFPGKYNKASTRYLQKSELQRIPRPELKIMRNEIFARYGLIFQRNGEMDKYFRAQEWYSGVHQNVEAFLTDIEKKNIALIQSMEGN